MARTLEIWYSTDKHGRSRAMRFERRQFRSFPLKREAADAAILEGRAVILSRNPMAPVGCYRATAWTTEGRIYSAGRVMATDPAAAERMYRDDIAARMPQDSGRIARVDINEGGVMGTKFASAEDYADAAAVADEYPGATEIIPVDGGWMVCDTVADAETWRSQV